MSRTWTSTAWTVSGNLLMFWYKPKCWSFSPQISIGAPQRPGTVFRPSLATSWSRYYLSSSSTIFLTRTRNDQVAQKLFPDFASSCFNLLRHKALMIGPKLLEVNGVRVQKVAFRKYTWHFENILCIPKINLALRKYTWHSENILGFLKINLAFHFSQIYTIRLFRHLIQ